MAVTWNLMAMSLPYNSIIVDVYDVAGLGAGQLMAASHSAQDALWQANLSPTNVGTDVCTENIFPLWWSRIDGGFHLAAALIR